MIPKVINYVWLGGKDKPKSFYRYLESWKKFCPDYKIKEWNENNFDININQFVKEAYSAKKYAFVSDYIRLYVLYHFGGIYMDIDIELVKPLEISDKSLILSFENNSYLQTGFIASKPKLPALKELLDIYNKKHFLLKDGKENKLPNPFLWTSVMNYYYPFKLNGKTQVLLDEVVVYSKEYFCAKNFATGIIQQTHNTVAIHHFDSTWFSKRAHKTYKFVKSTAKFPPLRWLIVSISEFIYRQMIKKHCRRFRKEKKF